MLIPKDVSKRKFKKGDIVILLKDLDLGHYIITKGHELIYWGYGDYGIIVKIPETGTILRKSRPEITHKVTMEESKKISIRVKERRKFINFIEEKCPHKDYTYEDRDKVDVCRASKKDRLRNYSSSYCNPRIECFQHIPKDKYKNNSFILNYNRKIKLKKIKQLNNGDIKTS